MHQIPNSQLHTKYLLYLADTTNILACRNSEWCGHGPVLEQDIAITNISLDLLGQARMFYQYAAELIGNNASEDSLAYLREEREYQNLLLVEQPRGDWAVTVLRQYLFSQFQYFLFQQLEQNSNERLRAIATKSLKEITYHVRWSKEWVVRLGDGSTESNQRIKNAITELWTYTGEMFVVAEYENEFANLATIQQQWKEKVTSVFEEATLTIPENTFMQTGGKNGIHTEHLGYILADMQYLQRSIPNAEW